MILDVEILKNEIYTLNDFTQSPTEFSLVISTTYYDNVCISCHLNYKILKQQNTLWCKSHL